MKSRSLTHILNNASNLKFLVFLILFPISIFANISNSSSNNTSINIFNDSSDNSSNNIDSGYLGTRSINFINPNFSDSNIRSLDYFEGKVLKSAENQNNFMGLDVFGQFSTRHSEFSNFTLNEAYYKADPVGNGILFYVGRRRSFWSRLDDLWKTGAYQPVYKVDPLNPMSQGLTGVFVDIKINHWNIEFFGSSLFIPDQGPQVETDNGSFIKRDPWVYYPPSENIINGVLTPVAYSIDKPSIQEIISKKSFGVNAQFGKKETEGFSGGISWANKPMNQLLLGLNGFLVLNDMTASDATKVDVQLRPEVGNHTLKSIDLNYKYNQWLISLGYIEDIPEKKMFAPKWTFQNHLPSQLMGGGVEYENNIGIKVGLNYLKKQGGESLVYGPEKDLVGSFIPERYSFSELFKMNITFQNKINQKVGIETQGEWKKELKESSELLALKVAVLVGPFWKAFVGLDLLKTENKIINKKDFIEANLENDRIYGGIQYVF